MFAHSVYFWLKEECTEAQRATFREGLDSLKDIAAAEMVYVGTPASTERPVIDKTYDFGLVVILKDLDAHDAYQKDPIHQKFVDTFSGFWTKILVYDFD